MREGAKKKKEGSNAEPGCLELSLRVGGDALWCSSHHPCHTPHATPRRKQQAGFRAAWDAHRSVVYIHYCGQYSVRGTLPCPSVVYVRTSYRGTIHQYASHHPRAHGVMGVPAVRQRLLLRGVYIHFILVWYCAGGDASRPLATRRRGCTGLAAALRSHFGCTSG